MDFERDLDREIRVQIWEAGIGLGISWKKFGDPRQIQQQREMAGTLGSPMMMKLMLSDVYGHIADGKVVALGYRIEPTASDGPILVPSDTFAVGLEFEGAFHRDEVTASGWKYERVTLLSKEDFEELMERHRQLDTTAPIVKSTPSSNSGKRGGGRHSLYPNAKIIFQRLFSKKPFLKGRPAEKIADDFNELYGETFSPDGKDFTSLDVRTIRTHLKTYRKELETIGKNQ